MEDLLDRSCCGSLSLLTRAPLQCSPSILLNSTPRAVAAWATVDADTGASPSSRVKAITAGQHRFAEWKEKRDARRLSAGTPTRWPKHIIFHPESFVYAHEAESLKAAMKRRVCCSGSAGVRGHQRHPAGLTACSANQISARRLPSRRLRKVPALPVGMDLEVTWQPA